MYEIPTKPEIIGQGNWSVIHIIARDCTTKEEKKAAAFCIAKCIFAFPCMTCRKHATGYAGEHPFKPAILSEEDFSLFKYTVDFHNFVNQRLGKRHVAWKKALEIWSNGHSPEIIGTGAWSFIHTVSRSCTTREEKKYAAYCIAKYISAFPHIPSRKNSSKYVRENPLKPAIEDDENPYSLFYWTVKFHNWVNQRIGKNTIDLKDALELWDDSNVCLQDEC